MVVIEVGEVLEVIEGKVMDEDMEEDEVEEWEEEEEELWEEEEEDLDVDDF